MSGSSVRVAALQFRANSPGLAQVSLVAAGAIGGTVAGVASGGCPGLYRLSNAKMPENASIPFLSSKSCLMMDEAASPTEYTVPTAAPSPEQYKYHAQQCNWHYAYPNAFVLDTDRIACMSCDNLYPLNGMARLQRSSSRISEQAIQCKPVWHDQSRKY